VWPSIDKYGPIWWPNIIKYGRVWTSPPHVAAIIRRSSWYLNPFRTDVTEHMIRRLNFYSSNLLWAVFVRNYEKHAKRDSTTHKSRFVGEHQFNNQKQLVSDGTTDWSDIANAPDATRNEKTQLRVCSGHWSLSLVGIEWKLIVVDSRETVLHRNTARPIATRPFRIHSFLENLLFL